MIDWIPNPTFLYYNEQNATYYAGFLEGLYTSSDGINWTQTSYFIGKPCVAMCGKGEHLVVSEVNPSSWNDHQIYFSLDGGNSWTASVNGPPTFDIKFDQEGVLYAVFPSITLSSGLHKSFDNGNLWDAEFWSTSMSTFGFDVFGNHFVGWNPNNKGLAHYEMVGMYDPEFTYFNEGLGNTFINKIKTNPTMSAPALFVCTEGGVYYSYDLMVGEKEVAAEKIDIEIYPNPVQKSGNFNIYFPRFSSRINVKLFSNTGELVFEKTIPNQTNSNIQLEIPKTESGLYYCHITSDNSHFVKKLVIR